MESHRQLRNELKRVQKTEESEKSHVPMVKRPARKFKLKQIHETYQITRTVNNFSLLKIKNNSGIWIPAIHG